MFRAQELRYESRGGRPVLPVPNSPQGLCGPKARLEEEEAEEEAEEEESSVLWRDFVLPLII